MGDFQNHARFMEPYSINFGWIIRTSTRTSALLVVGWGNHTIFTFSSCVFSQPDQPNIKRWVPSKFKTLERADRFFWEFYFLVLTHQCWRIARSLNDLGVPPNSTDLQLGLLKLGHSHSWLIFWSESCWLMVALISNHKVGRFNLAIPKRRISIILNHGLGDYINGWENTAWTLFFLTGVVNIPFFEDFEDIIPPFLFLCCLYISPLLWKKTQLWRWTWSHTAASASVQDRHDFHSLLQEEVRIKDSVRNAWHWRRMTTMTDANCYPTKWWNSYICPYDYDSHW